jgi:hypothetical protein
MQGLKHARQMLYCVSYTSCPFALFFEMGPTNVCWSQLQTMILLALPPDYLELQACTTTPSFCSLNCLSHNSMMHNCP